MNPDITHIQPLGRILSRTGKSFLQLLNEKLNHLDIERNYYALLLIEAGEGNITQQELANQLETDKVSVVRIVDYLASKGYVQRIKSPADRRKYSLMLTEKAKGTLPGIKEALEEVTGSAAVGLTEMQVKEFYSTLFIIKNNLSKANFQSL